MNEKFSKALPEFHRTTMRQRFEDRMGRNEEPIDVPGNIETRKEPNLDVPDVENIPPEELSPEDQKKAINAIFVGCGWDPKEAYEHHEEEIAKFVPEPHFKSKQDAQLKKTTAVRVWESADKEYKKELGSIEDMTKNAFATQQNNSLIEAARKRACAAVAKIAAAKKIVDAANKYITVML
jgi:hypothetical protein